MNSNALYFLYFVYVGQIVNHDSYLLPEYVQKWLDDNTNSIYLHGSCLQYFDNQYQSYNMKSITDLYNVKFVSRSNNSEIIFKFNVDNIFTEISQKNLSVKYLAIVSIKNMLY